MKITSILFNDCLCVKKITFRKCCPSTRVVEYVKINRRYKHARSTVDSRDFFQVPSNSKILNTFWDRDSKLKALLSMNYLRLPYIKDNLVDTEPHEKLSTSLKGKKILEVGCGAGILSEGLAKYGAEVTGIDANKQVIGMAQEHSSKNRRLANNEPTYIFTTIEDHCISNPNTYDAIVVSEVMQHVTEKELFVESCSRATKPGGKLFFMTSNRTLFAQFYFIFIIENVLRCFPKAQRYDNFITPSELKYMLEMNDCHVKDIKGYMYYPWGDYWAWTNHKLSSFAMQAIKSLPINDSS